MPAPAPPSAPTAGSPPTPSRRSSATAARRAARSPSRSPPSAARTPPAPATSSSRPPLSRRGRIWSYTDARYQPPPPYVVPGDEHVPFCIAAVELPAEKLIVLGQVVAGVTVDDLTIGQEVELVVDTLFVDDEAEHQIFKWQPVAGGAA